MPKHFTSTEEHLNAYRWIDESHSYNGTPCWRWFGAKSKNGYGTITVDCKQWSVHRLVAVKHLGLDPKDSHTQVCHHCDVKDCFNPGHLFLGSHAANMNDAVAKKRQFQSSKTHCPKGHPYEGDNVAIDNRGGRYCVACSRAKAAFYRAKKNQGSDSPTIN